MKMPPRTGTVQKMPGNRRKPYLAKRFIGWRVNDDTRKSYPVYKSIGTFAKKSDAIRALIKASETPEDKRKYVTLEEVYNEWSMKKFTEIKDVSVRMYTNAWSYLSPLKDRPISELKTADYEQTVEHGKAPRTIRHNIQLLVNALYKTALAHEYCEKDISALTDFHPDVSTQIKRKVFTPEEVQALFTSDNVKDQMILVGIFTGMRPGELLALKRSEVDLENGFLRIAGSKTKSGVLRDIPIHADILPIIIENCTKSSIFGKQEVFLSVQHRAYSRHTYYDYVKIKGHTPHDTRHSFATYSKRSGLDSLAVKRIMGHKTERDVTEDVYTHTDDVFLRREMEKFRIA